MGIKIVRDGGRSGFSRWAFPISDLDMYYDCQFGAEE
jgi:hypothetical protein